LGVPVRLEMETRYFERVAGGVAVRELCEEM
jgi:hypothetical protein